MRKGLFLAVILALSFGFFDCSSSSDGGSGGPLDGKWQRTTSNKYELKFSGNKWVYSVASSVSNPLEGCDRGIWSSTPSISIPSNGSLTLIINEYYDGTGWKPTLDTGTGTFNIDATGTTLIISGFPTGLASFLSGNANGTWTKVP